MKRKIGLVASIVVTLFIAGCGGSVERNGDATTSETKIATSGWDATDACALLDKTAVGAALGDKVTEATVGLVNQASGANAATSECTYLLESGGRASLMTRNSPIADNTPEAIAMARKTMQEAVSAFGKTIEDVPGLGISATFVPGINQLNVYLDDKRFVILTISSAPNQTAKLIAQDLIGKMRQ